MTYLDSLKALDDQLLSNLKKVQLVAFDVDGVLTDGRLAYGEKGEALKVFNVKDGVGFKLLEDYGVIVAVISAKSSAMVNARMRELGVKHLFTGIKDKRQVIRDLMGQFELEPAQCCFVGDDMVDTVAMSDVGVALCPSDAYPMVFDKVDYVLPIGGGRGVARYVADLVLVAKGMYEDAYKLAASPQFERKR